MLLRADTSGVGATSDLIGRGQLLREITAGLASGQGAILRGPAGVGKTRLLREIVCTARQAGRRTDLVIASAGTSSVPFGPFLPFLPFLPATHGAHPDGPTEDAGSRSPMVGGSAPARRVVLGAGLDVLAVDDAHLLDAGSVGLLHECAAAGVALLLAIRQTTPPQDGLLELWRSGHCRLHDLSAFDEGESGEFIRALLGGDVDTGLARTLHRRCGGNPLAMRELLLAAQRVDAVVADRGLWVQRGPLPQLPRLAELLRRHVEPLDPPTRRVVELVALGEPMPLGLLAAVADQTAIEDAEANGILTVDTALDDDTQQAAAGGGTDMAGRSAVTNGLVLRLSHPLYRDAVLSMLPSLRRRRHYGDLLAATAVSMDAKARIGRDGTGSSADVDRIAVATWQLELARPVRVPELLSLAELTLLTDPALCERFLRAAVAADGGARAQLRLAELLAHRHRADEAESVLQAIDLSRLDERTAVGIAITRAFLLAMSGQRPDDALGQIDDLITAHGAVPALLAVRSTALWRSLRLTQALDQAMAVVDDADAPADAVAHARLTLLSVQVAKANSAALSVEIPRTRQVVESVATALPEGAASIDLIEALTPLQTAMDVTLARTRAQDGYRRALLIGDDGLRAQFGFQLGWVNLLQGNTIDAVRLIREADAARGLWCSTTWPWVRSLLVEALVVSGAQDEARTLAADLMAAGRAPVFDVDVAIARAAVLAGQGDLGGAGRAAAQAGDAAVASGQTALAMTAWYAALRYGHPDGGRRFMQTCSATMGVGRIAQRTQARAVLAQDPVALEAAAALLGRAHLAWFAIETQSAAVAMYRARADPQSAAAAHERLRVLLAASPGLDSPVVRALGRPTLTARESEVAGMAAAGTSDREIADQLGMSLRTAQTHLARAFGKLGVHSRRELAVALRGPSADLGGGTA